MADCCSVMSDQDRDLALIRVLHMGALRFRNSYEKIPEAEQLYKAALMVLDEVDDDHPEKAETAIRLNLDMAESVYADSGRLAEAETLTVEWMRQAEEKLGAEHIVTVFAASNLADIHTMRGRFAEAEPLYKRALAVLDREPAPHAEGLAAVLKSYAAMLRLAGRTDEAAAIEARLAGAATGESYPAATGTASPDCGSAAGAPEPQPAATTGDEASPAADAAPTNPAEYGTGGQA